MKKIVIVFLCIIIVGMGVSVFLRTQKPDSSIGNILPQDALVYVQLNDVEKNMKEMASMPFWQAIENINYDLLMEKNALNSQQKMFINLVRKQISKVLTNPLSAKLLGKEVAFAVYLPDRDIDVIIQEMKIYNPLIVEEILSGLFLVTRVDRDVQFAEFVSRFFSQYGSNISKEQVEYKGEVIHTITLADAGMKFGIVRLKDLLVIGIGETAARMSIDVFKGDKPALARDPQFAKIQSTFLDPSDMVGFFDFETFFALVKTQMEKFVKSKGAEEAAGVDAQLEKMFAKVSGFKTVTFSSQLMPVLRFDSHLLFDSRKLDPEYASIYTCSPEKNKTISFVPGEILGYQWSNCFQLDHYWRQIQKELARMGSSASKVDDFEAKMGLSVDRDILPTFGSEIGGYISDIQVGGFFPIPKLLFFVEIKNKSKAEYLLDKLKEQPFAMFQDENYKGVSIKYFALPLGESLQPGYCFLEDYLLIATARQLLKDSVDVSKGGLLSLSGSPVFREINFGLTDKNRSVQFVKMGKVIEKAKGIIGWSNQWMSAQDQKSQAFKAGGEKPLEEVTANIAAKEGELKEIHNQIISLEDDIWSFESKGMDTNAQQAQLADLKNQVSAKELELAGERERKVELEGIVQGYKEHTADAARRQLYLDEVVYPVLEGLKAIESYGLRVTLGKDSFKSSLFLKISDK